MNKLNRREFREALSSGLGRALLHVKTYGTENVRDIIRDACVHNATYDRQVEDCRADWLMEIIQASREVDYFEEQIVEQYKTSTEPDDIDQMSALLACFVKSGRSHLKHLLYQQFENSTHDQFCTAESIIRADGIDGLTFIIKSDLDWEDPWIELWFVRVACEATNARCVLSYLQSPPRKRWMIRSFWRRVKRERNARRQRSRQSKNRPAVLSFEQAMDIVNTKDSKDTYALRRYGVHASESEIEEIFQMLVAEKKHWRLENLLKIFAERALPRFHQRLLDKAYKSTDQLRRDVLLALSRTAEPKLRQFALDSIRHKPSNAGDFYLKLLELNYRDGDEVIVENALRQLTDRDTKHGAGIRVLDLAKNRANTFSNSLQWTYENTPCSRCRFNAVEKLLSIGQLDEHMVNECLHDCDEGIRNLACGYLNKMNPNHDTQIEIPK